MDILWDWKDSKMCVKKKRVDGLTVNILDKCRQGLNLFSKRSNALCGTQLQSLKHLSLPITFQKYRKRLVILRLFGKTKFNWSFIKFWGWPAPACFFVHYHEQSPSTSRCSAWSTLKLGDVYETLTKWIRTNVQKKVATVVTGNEAQLWKILHECTAANKQFSPSLCKCL